VNLTQYDAEYHGIDFTHAAFTGGYGAVLLQNQSGVNLWQAYIKTNAPNRTMHSASGNVFSNGIYKVPYTTSIDNIIITVTNLTGGNLTIVFENLAPGLEYLNKLVYPLSTFRFDAVALGWDVNGAIRASCAGGSFAISALHVKGAGKWLVWPTQSPPT
jgi:hypothetical protein